MHHCSGICTFPEAVAYKGFGNTLSHSHCLTSSHLLTHTHTHEEGISSSKKPNSYTHKPVYYRGFTLCDEAIQIPFLCSGLLTFFSFLFPALSFRSYRVMMSWCLLQLHFKWFRILRNCRQTKGRRLKVTSLFARGYLRFTNTYGRLAAAPTYNWSREEKKLACEKKRRVKGWLTLLFLWSAWVLSRFCRTHIMTHAN